MKVVTLAGIIGLIITISSSVLAIDHYFVSAEDFESHIAYSEERDLERTLEALQDKLAGLLAIPESQRAEWQVREIIRLKNRIDSVKSKIQRLG